MAHLTCAAKHRPASWSGWRQAILPPRDAEAKASKSARGPRTGGQGPPGRREEIACPKISGRGSPARNVELFKPPPTVPSRDYTLHKYECGPPPTLSARRVPLRSLRSHDRASSNKCAVQPIRPSPSLRQAGRLSLAAALLAARSRARSRRSCRRRRAQNPAPVCRQPLPSHRRLVRASVATLSAALRLPALPFPALPLLALPLPALPPFSPLHWRIPTELPSLGALMLPPGLLPRQSPLITMRRQRAVPHSVQASYSCPMSSAYESSICY